ncbi:MAG: metallophosphoesterase [Leptospiraceae bacterium]|nr:metallophosphoesterase [Leptospiraceae bacterium]MCP5512491.1 metallophosphoesterase [Leptospiraceae bacterium]
MKIIHISDLHLPTQLPFFSLKGKMYTGYLNYAFRRKSRYPISVLNGLLLKIKSMDYNLLVISGDFTNVSHEMEFPNVYDAMSPILDSRTFVIPGNHDRYMESSIRPVDLFKKYFQNYQGEKCGSGSTYLYRKKIGNTHIIGIDSGYPTGVGIAAGRVEENSINELQNLLKNEKIKDYILVCHHPIWNPEEHMESESHRLTNRDFLLNELKKNPPSLFLHGHKHTNWYRRKDEEIPFGIINSASSTMLPDSKRNNGFHYIEYSEKGNHSVQRFSFDGTSFREDRLIEY